MQKLKLSKISIFLHMNLYLSCKIFQKNGLKSNEFLNSSNSLKLKILLVPKQREERIVCPRIIELYFKGHFFDSNHNFIPPCNLKKEVATSF